MTARRPAAKAGLPDGTRDEAVFDMRLLHERLPPAQAGRQSADRGGA